MTRAEPTSRSPVCSQPPCPVSTSSRRSSRNPWVNPICTGSFQLRYYYVLDLCRSTHLLRQIVLPDHRSGPEGRHGVRQTDVQNRRHWRSLVLFFLWLPNLYGSYLVAGKRRQKTGQLTRGVGLNWRVGLTRRVKLTWSVKVVKKATATATAASARTSNTSTSCSI